MERTGMLRRVDKLGRVLLPTAIRRQYHLDCDEMVEIYTQRNGIWLKNFDIEADIIAQAGALYESVDQMEQDIMNKRELREYLKKTKRGIKRLAKKAELE